MLQTWLKTCVLWALPLREGKTACDVLREAGVAGKSFMLPMYKDLPEQTMADLLEYISTLK